MPSAIEGCCLLRLNGNGTSYRRLVSHEELRDQGKLLYCDTPKSLIDRLVVFFSHQWTARSFPDPSGQQYAVMASSLQHVALQNGWELSNVFVWVE